MLNKNTNHMSTPELLLFDLNTKNNQWIIKARILFSLFFLIFFLFCKKFFLKEIITSKDLILIFTLAQIGNILFHFTLRSLMKKRSDSPPLKELFSLSRLQLDFDLIIMTMIIFVSGGINSYLVYFLILYVMISAFIVEKSKHIKNTLILIFFLIILPFADVHVFNPDNIVKLISILSIIIFSFFASSYISRNSRENQRVLEQLLQKSRELSITDNLSGLYNQRHFFEQLSMLLKKAKRYKNIFSLILFDIDNFKNYNDSNGHLKGSAAIEKVGKMVASSFRDFDISARYGGDEFVVILPDTDKIGALLAADRFRELVEKTEFAGMETQPMKKITLSIGISSFPEHGDSVEEIIENADIALYTSKSEGRNRVTIFEKDQKNSFKKE